MRLAAGTIEGLVSLTLNVLAVVALVHWAFPREMPTPKQTAIEVEIVNKGPDAKAGKADFEKSAEVPNASPQTAEPGKPEPSPEAASAPTDSVASAASETKPVAPPVPLPAPPDPVPSAPAQNVSQAPENQPSLSLNPLQPAPQPQAMPAPVGAEDPQVKPHLVEVPPAPTETATQNATNVPANAVPEPANTGEKPPEPATAPAVLASPAGEDEVPGATMADPAALQGETPAPETAEQAANTAKLAAALPFSQSFAPSSARAATSGTGTANDQRYKSAVYGSFSKAADVVEAAQANHLKGQTVVAFTIDDTGALKSLAIAISSGTPAVDAAALDYIRHAAPFPAPPPGAQRSFSPAISFGLD